MKFNIPCDLPFEDDDMTRYFVPFSLPASYEENEASVEIHWLSFKKHGGDVLFGIQYGKSQHEVPCHSAGVALERVVSVLADKMKFKQEGGLYLYRRAARPQDTLVGEVKVLQLSIVWDAVSA